jgi:beta-phosphoglucomutase
MSSRSLGHSATPQLQAVIFDLDGVITDTAEFHFLAWQQLAAELGIGFSRHDNEQLKGVDRLGSLKLILQQGGLTLDAAAMQHWSDWKNQRYLELLVDMQPNDVFPLVPELLASLRASGLLLGLASASRNAPLVLERLQLTNAFDFIADPAKQAQGKPAPDIFLAVSTALKVAPESCIGVEDAPAGITAVKAAGMKAVGIGTPTALAQADLVLPATGMLTPLLLKQSFAALRQRS